MYPRRAEEIVHSLRLRNNAITRTQKCHQTSVTSRRHLAVLHPVELFADTRNGNGIIRRCG